MAIKKPMVFVNVVEEMVLKRAQWKERINAAETKYLGLDDWVVHKYVKCNP